MGKTHRKSPKSRVEMPPYTRVHKDPRKKRVKTRLRDEVEREVRAYFEETLP